MDCLIIGCGICGAVIARELAEAGKKIVIWERRDHIGGNMYDYVDEHGVLVQKYGPHIFHTSDKKLYDYMCQYGDWAPYDLQCGAEIDGTYTPTPFNFQTIDDFYTKQDGDELKARIAQAFPDRDTATVTEVLHHPDEMVHNYGQFLFDKDYSLYTAKQWGTDPSEVDPSVLARVPLRFSYKNRYFDDTYQAMPVVSFTAFFQKLLQHPNITVEMGVEALEHLKVEGNTLTLDGRITTIPVVYTGALDELFHHCAGELPYRSLRFEWKYKNVESIQDAPVVAYPQAEGYTRITEFKKLPVQQVEGTSYAVEYPLTYKAGAKQEPYYPVPTEESKKQYQTYEDMAKKVPNLYRCGRLAEFKYYNMDQALAAALTVADTLSQ